MGHKNSSTEYLNEKLLQTNNLKSFLKENKQVIAKDTFAVALGKKIDENELTNSDVFKKANISHSTGYQILNGRRLPSRDKVLQLTVALGLNLEETNKLLRLSKHGELYVKEKRDAVLIFSINNTLNLMEINDILYEEDLKILE